MIQKEFIRNELRYRYPSLTDSICQPQQAVGRPLLLEGGSRAFGARIIVCTGEELSAFQGTGQSEPLFLCIGVPNQKQLDEFDVCVLPQTEQTGVVLNFIQRLFDRLDDWTQSLRQAAETGEGVEQLLVRASEMLQNPVLLLDARGHVVAQSALSESTEPTALLQTDKSMDTEYATVHVQRIGNSSAPEAMYCRLQSGETRYTLFCPASERPLYASDEMVLESLAGFLRLMLSERTLRFDSPAEHRERDFAARLFRALMMQDGTEQQSCESLEKIGWGSADEYAVLAIEPINGDLRTARADAICDLLGQELEGSCAFSFSPVIVAIVRTGLLEIDAMKAKLRALAKDHALRIGMCESLAGFRLFSERLQQAKQALNHADEFDGAAGTSDVFAQELSNWLQQDTPKELLCMRSVRALTQYDHMHDTNYLETAEQYVINRFNAVRTAGALFIHRSTFLYRLERIKTQFGLDLDDKNLSMLHLLFSFQLVSDF